MTKHAQQQVQLKSGRSRGGQEQHHGQRNHGKNEMKDHKPNPQVKKNEMVASLQAPIMKQLLNCIKKTFNYGNDTN